MPSSVSDESDYDALSHLSAFLGSSLAGQISLLANWSWLAVCRAAASDSRSRLWARKRTAQHTPGRKLSRNANFNLQPALFPPRPDKAVIHRISNQAPHPKQPADVRPASALSSCKVAVIDGK